MCDKHRSCKELRVWRLPQIKMTFLPHSVVETDSTLHSSSRRGRLEADKGLTWFLSYG